MREGAASRSPGASVSFSKCHAVLTIPRGPPGVVEYSQQIQNLRQRQPHLKDEPVLFVDAPPRQFACVEEPAARPHTRGKEMFGYRIETDLFAKN